MIDNLHVSVKIKYDPYGWVGLGAVLGEFLLAPSVGSLTRSRQIRSSPAWIGHTAGRLGQNTG